MKIRYTETLIMIRLELKNMNRSIMLASDPICMALICMALVNSMQSTNPLKPKIHVYIAGETDRMDHEEDSTGAELHYRFREPPAAPLGMGTWIYPWDTEPLEDLARPEIQMTLSSMNRHEQERKMLAENKIKNHEEIWHKQRYTVRRRPYCHICSEATSSVMSKQKNIYHRHVSSISQRAASPLDHFGQYVCTTCKTVVHPAKMGHRIPVVISASIMNNWQGWRGTPGAYEGDPLHLDYITIPGATIEQLQHAFEAQYNGCKQPLDVIIVAGYNNILQDQCLEEILSHLSDFKKAVINMSCPGERFNSCAISSLPFPPRLTRLVNDPVFPEYSEYYDDKTSILDQLTPRVLAMNREEIDMLTRLAPGFHSWCLSKGGDSGQQGYTVGQLNQHRDAQWREDHFLDQLHPSDPVRVRMGMAIGRYFRNLYGIETMTYNSKQEWHEAKKGLSNRNKRIPDTAAAAPEPEKTVDQLQLEPDDDDVLILSDVYIAAALDISEGEEMS